MRVKNKNNCKHHDDFFLLLVLLFTFFIVYIDGKITASSTNNQWHYAPASLLFPPTSRRPEAECNFKSKYELCRDWRIWQIVNELIISNASESRTIVANNDDYFYFPLDQSPASRWPNLASGNYRIVSENIPDDGNNSGVMLRFSYLSVENSAQIYVMSEEMAFNKQARGTPSICFTYYYRIMSTSLGRMKAYVLSKSVNDIDDGYYTISGAQLVWNETGRWPATWSWLVNTVQLQLPKNTSKIRVVFYLDAGDGLAALDDVEMYNTSCNLRPTPVNNTASDSSATGGNKTVDTAAKARAWPTNSIAFEIGLGFSAMQQDFLNHVLDDLSLHTCVSFVRRQLNELDYVEFIHTSEGCTSQRIGYYGGKQRVHLADSCFDKSTISHELLHVVGLFHEHQRPDRDAFVDVLLSNVDPAYKEQFAKYPTMDSRLLSVPYDYGSVMHYRDNAFAARRGLKTMQAKDNTTKILGNVQGPVFSDYKKVANLYCNGEIKPLSEALLPRSPPFLPRLWDNGEIPIEFDYNFTDDQRNALLNVITEVNSHTCLRIRPRIQGEINYVFFQLTNGECFARSGKLGGRQVVSLYPGSCFSRPLLFWLILHVAGLDAEHRRPDRDDFIDVHDQNIGETHTESFQKFQSMDWRIMSVPYDMTSVLHYAKNAFSKSRTLNTLTAKVNVSLALGNKVGPTPLDYAKIIRLYNCSTQYWKDIPIVPGSPSPSTTPSPWSNISAKSPPVEPLAIGTLSLPRGPNMQFRLARLPMIGPLRPSVQLNARLWPSRQIPYVVSALQFKMFEAWRIGNVIRNFNAKTCLKFVPLTNQTDFVEFVKDTAAGLNGACRASNYGRKGGRQLIILPMDACFETDYFLYLALLTTAGIAEEHRRSDRDEYVQILWSNIVENAKPFFDTYSDTDPRILMINYDFQSITHYSNEAFSKQNGLKTMFARGNASLPLGNKREPTPLDYEKVANLYC